jgi:hypothetical protein
VDQAGDGEGWLNEEKRTQERSGRNRNIPIDLARPAFKPMVGRRGMAITNDEHGVHIDCSEFWGTHTTS